jgi:hypothetical protein
MINLMKILKILFWKNLKNSLVFFFELVLIWKVLATELMTF